MTPGARAEVHPLSEAHLDAIRGAAALLVVVYHVRYKFFADFSEVGDAGIATRLFYAATSFGHDAVMVFFVLSGYLVGGSVLKDLRAGRWSWSRYLTRRLTRLYVVLIPALVLTACWDALGLLLFPQHVAYTGAPQSWVHDFFDVRAFLTGPIALENLVFMHGFGGTPPLGTNIPLWSLTFEVAYYLMFPAMATALWASTKAGMRLVGAALFGCAAFWFGPRIVVFFVVWLFGVAVKEVSDRTMRSASALGWAPWPLATVVFGAVAVLRHTRWFQTLTGVHELVVGDFLVGLSFAALLFCLLQHKRPPRSTWYPRLARHAAAISYTLYATHMPLLIFLRAWWEDGANWAPEPGRVLLGGLAVAAALGQAAVLFLLFERHTPRLQESIARRWLPAAARREHPLAV